MGEEESKEEESTSQIPSRQRRLIRRAAGGHSEVDLNGVFTPRGALVAIWIETRSEAATRQPSVPRPYAV